MHDDPSGDDPTQVSQPLGPRIRVARENAGLSVAEAARRLGVAKATLQAWEDDRETPRANRLLMLAGLLNVSLSWFLEGRESEHMATQGDVAPDTLRRQLEEIRLRLDDVLDSIVDLERRLGPEDDDN
jgi:transcriptional regulator with XRE-family HTH domain